MSHGYYSIGRDIEAIDLIESLGFGYNMGNVIKYIVRHGRKPGVESVDDLKKSRWYLDREIARLDADGPEAT